MAATLVFIVIHWLISFIAKDWPTLGEIVKSHDTVLDQERRIDREALEDAHMSPDDLAEDLREQGVAGKAAVKEARLERSGKLSVIRK